MKQYLFGRGARHVRFHFLRTHLEYAGKAIFEQNQYNIVPACGVRKRVRRKQNNIIMQINAVWERVDDVKGGVNPMMRKQHQCTKIKKITCEHTPKPIGLDLGTKSRNSLVVRRVLEESIETNMPYPCRNIMLYYRWSALVFDRSCDDDYYYHTVNSIL